MSTTLTTRTPAGLYVHIPFCLKKCPYCDFYSQTDLSKKKTYLRALISEMALIQRIDQTFDTVYLGGGTPSLLTGGEVEMILAKARSAYRIDRQAEITLEVNPGTGSALTFNDYRRAGVNRINVGVQSFDNRRLKKLGRVHTAETAIQCLKQVVGAGYKNVGIDLIYGIPGQTPDDWKKDLVHALQFKPKHISCYMLSFETGTPFDVQRLAGRLKPLNDSTVADMYRMTVHELASAGYHQYEVSNFALSGAQSRHNTKYWNNAPYLGVGASAHTYDGSCRSWNVKGIDRYVKLVTEGIRPLSGEEQLTRTQQMLEAIYLGLRTTAGIQKREFEKRFGVDISEQFGEVVADLDEKGFVHSRQDRVALTVEGMLLLDAIVVRMSDQIEDIKILQA